MIRAVIIEDEDKSREVLSGLISNNCPGMSILGTADSVASGVELIHKVKPDLLFLDIVMPDGSGFDLLEQVQDQNFDVIFTTASDKYAVKAIKYSALDYLLKPIDVDELILAVDKISKKQLNLSNIKNLQFLLQNMKKPDDNFSRITIPTGNAYEIVNIPEIIRCEAEGHYTNFILTNKRNFLVSTGLKHYEDLLPAEHFIRVHHHHLININHVVRFIKEDSGYAVMTDGTKVEVSRRKKDFFLQRLNSL